MKRPRCLLFHPLRAWLRYFPRSPSLLPSCFGLNPDVRLSVCIDIHESVFSVESNGYHQSTGGGGWFPWQRHNGLEFQTPLLVWLRVKGWGLSQWPVSAGRGPPGEKGEPDSWQNSEHTLFQLPKYFSCLCAVEANLPDPRWITFDSKLKSISINKSITKGKVLYLFYNQYKFYVIE